MEKQVDCKVLVSKSLRVTKQFTERRKKDPHTENFGVGSSLEEVKNNVGLTIVQRDNIWHPYYEVKLEEDDMASRMRKTIENKQAHAALGNDKIVQLEATLAAHIQAEKDEEEMKKLAEAAALNPHGKEAE